MCSRWNFCRCHSSILSIHFGKWKRKGWKSLPIFHLDCPKKHSSVFKEKESACCVKFRAKSKTPKILAFLGGQRNATTRNASFNYLELYYSHRCSLRWDMGSQTKPRTAPDKVTRKEKSLSMMDIQMEVDYRTLLKDRPSRVSLVMYMSWWVELVRWKWHRN